MSSLYSIQAGFIFLIFPLDWISCHFLTLFLIFSFSFSFQQHTGERKQMAKAMAAANKASKQPSSSFKKRPSGSPAAVPSFKRRSYQPDRVVTCFNCQQPGHIAPRCPSRSPAVTTPAAKAAPAKKWGAFASSLDFYYLNKYCFISPYFHFSDTI